MVKKFTLMFELTNNCTAHCITCLTPTMKRKRGYMEFETFMNTLSQAKNLDIEAIQLNGQGEGMLHPKWEQFSILSKILFRRTLSFKRSRNFSAGLSKRMENTQAPKRLLSSSRGGMSSSFPAFIFLIVSSTSFFSAGESLVSSSNQLFMVTTSISIKSTFCSIFFMLSSKSLIVAFAPI